MRERSATRLILSLIALLCSFGSAWADAAACPGRSLLTEIETSRPDVWKAALADFEAIPNNTGLLWKIEKDGVAPSWLFGTMHVPAPGVTDFRPAIREAFDQSERLVLESTEVFDQGQMKVMEQVVQFARYPNDDESFDAGFTKEEKDALGAMTAAIGMPYFTARHFKPWFLALTLAIPPCMQLSVLHGELGVDAKLRQEAMAIDKPVVGLETRDEQIEALKSLDRAGIGPEQLKQLIAQGPKAAEDQMATQVDLYLQQRPALAVFLGRHMPELNLNAEDMPTLESLLVHDRNLRFRDRLLPLLQQGGTFVAVGALHLVDKDGLIELLRGNGYALTRAD